MFFKADTSDFHIYQAAQIIEVKDSDVANVRLSSESDAEVRGQIRTDKGEKLNWALVSFSLDSGEKDPEFDLVWPGPSTRGQFKPDGSFDIKKVPPGKYRVVFNADTPAARAYYIKSVTVGGQDVTESGFSIAGGIWSLDIVLSSAGATIEGAVVDAKEQPVPDATVVIVPNIEKRNQRDLFKKSTSDQHGHFKLEGVRPGEYTLLALDDLDEDYRDPDVLKPYEDRGQTIRVEKGERKGVLLKVIQTGD
jgi:Carboxypeptidase regulatory-like domain